MAGVIYSLKIWPYVLDINIVRCQILQRTMSVIYFGCFVFIQTCKAIKFRGEKTTF